MTSFISAWKQLDEPRHRAELYRLWSTGGSAGFTVPRALEIMGPRGDREVERARRWLLDGATRGASVAELASAPRAPFSPYESALLRVGEEAGRLEHALRLLAEYHDRKHVAMLGVRKRMAYPLFVAVAAAVIAPLPLLVAGRIAAYLGVVLVASCVALAAGGTVVAIAADRFGRAPELVRARFARALAVAIETGLPLGRAAQLAAGASGDRALAACVARVGELRLVGESLASTLDGCPHMSREFLAVVSNAERTGDFTGTLRRLADLYEDGFR